MFNRLLYNWSPYDNRRARGRPRQNLGRVSQPLLWPSCLLAVCPFLFFLALVLLCVSPGTPIDVEAWDVRQIIERARDELTRFFPCLFTASTTEHRASPFYSARSERKKRATNEKTSRGRVPTPAGDMMGGCSVLSFLLFRIVLSVFLGLLPDWFGFLASPVYQIMESLWSRKKPKEVPRRFSMFPVNKLVCLHCVVWRPCLIKTTDNLKDPVARQPTAGRQARKTAQSISPCAGRELTLPGSASLV